VFPLRKFYTEQLFVLLHTERMQLRNYTDTQTVLSVPNAKNAMRYRYTALNLESSKSTRMR